LPPVAGFSAPFYNSPNFYAERLAMSDPVLIAAESAALAAVARDPAAQVWLFSSSQCIAHLLRAPVDAATLAALRQVPVLATHARIAETARAAGFAAVVPVRPDPLEVRQALERSQESRA